MEDELERSPTETEEEQEDSIQYHILDDPGLVHYTEGLTQIFTAKKDIENTLDGYSKKSDLENYAKVADIESQLNECLKKSDIDGDFSEYAKKSEVNTRIEEVNQQIQQCESQLNEVIGIAQDLEALI